MSLTKPMEMVASAKGSPMMLARLNLLRLEVMLFALYGFFKDGEYSDLRPSMEEYYEADTDSVML